MPSTYAHRRFGADVLQQLPAVLQDQIGKNRALFDVGLHGPDLLFYYHAAKSNPVSALGNAMHEQPGRIFCQFRCTSPPRQKLRKAMNLSPP